MQVKLKYKKSLRKINLVYNKEVELTIHSLSVNQEIANQHIYEF